jgi:hypothetical protein
MSVDDPPLWYASERPEPPEGSDMAKRKAAPKVTPAATEERSTKPVRLDLGLEDHKRIERNAKRFGLSKSAYVRQALFKQLEADEGRGSK